MEDAAFYRQPGTPTVEYREQLVRRVRHRLEDSAGLLDVYVGRVRRIAFGVVASVSMITLALVVAIAWGGAQLGLFASTAPRADGTLTLAMAAIWIVAGLAHLVAGPIARGALHRNVESRLAPSGDLFADVARLEALDPSALLRRHLNRLRLASVRWPALGAVLLLPLTLHFFVALVGGAALGEAAVLRGAFDAWIVLSVALTFPAYLALAAALWRSPQAGSVLRSTCLGALWILPCSFVVASFFGVIVALVAIVIIALTACLVVPLVLVPLDACLRAEADRDPAATA